MRVLLDTCIWGGVRDALSDAGHDVVWTGDWEEDPGDDEIMGSAFAEGRVLVTLDKDFGTFGLFAWQTSCRHPSPGEPVYSTTSSCVSAYLGSV